MKAYVSVICYKSKTLSNGEHPLMLRISKDGKRKLHSLALSIHPQFWDFEKNKPKRNCPNKTAIEQAITKHLKQYQEQLMEFKVENKDFTAAALIEKISRPNKRMTVGELFLKQITLLKTSHRLGYAESLDYVYKSLLKFNGHLDIYFSDIDIQWLTKYEMWLRENLNSENTIGIKFRTLRAVYNGYSDKIGPHIPDQNGPL